MYRGLGVGIAITLASSNAMAAPNERGRVQTEVEAYFAPKIGSDGQYMHNGCKPPANYGRWRNVQRCDYTTKQMGISVSTTAYLIFPDAKQIARWVVGACEAAKKDLTSCAGRLSDRIWMASNAQFPVAGYVVEPPQEKTWKYQDRPCCMLFRNGVTIATKTWETQAEVGNHCGPSSEFSQPVAKAFSFARIGSTTRSNYVKANGIQAVGMEHAHSPEWATVAGDAFRSSLGSSTNFLLYAVVVGGFDACDINIFDKTAKPGKSCPKR